jgi:hypothetical protein
MIPRFYLRLFHVIIWMCRWRMNTLVTSQYQPRLSSITKIFSRWISQLDWNIQIKWYYSMITSVLKWKTKNTTLSDQLQNPIGKSISLTHKYMTLSWFGTGTKKWRGRTSFISPTSILVKKWQPSHITGWTALL